jgi:hypothetical protein
VEEAQIKKRVVKKTSVMEKKSTIGDKEKEPLKKQ